MFSGPEGLGNTQALIPAKAGIYDIFQYIGHIQICIPFPRGSLPLARNDPGMMVKIPFLNSLPGRHRASWLKDHY